MKPLIRTLIITGVTAASFMLLTTGVHAQHRGKGGPVFFNAPVPVMGDTMGMRGFGRGHMGHMNVMRMAEELNLSDEQRDKIGKIIDDTRPKLRKNGFAMMDNRKEIHALMQDGNVDDKKLRSLTRKQGDLTAEQMYLQLKMQSDIHNVLTDEQREKMQQRGMFRHRLLREDVVIPMPDEEED